MFRRLLFTSFDEEDLSPRLWRRAESQTTELIRVDYHASDYASQVASSDGIILRLGMAADSRFQDTCPGLKYIGMFGTGYGRIDVEHARARGIAVTNIAGYSSESVAELVAGMMLAEVRNLYHEHARGTNGDVSETSFEGRSLRALTIGVVGLGYIGIRLARLMAEGFGSNILCWSRHRHEGIESDLIRFTGLEELLEKSDVISIHLAMNPGTANFLNEQRIALLRTGTVLINTAPNELIDMEAVKLRCREGSLRYVMDHADELSFKDYSELRDTPNVTVYPPIGYATRETTEKKCEMLISNLESYNQGRSQNRVD